MGYFNYSSGFFESKDDVNMTRAIAIKGKWKCEKCSEKFPSYRMVREHKTLFHSY